MPEKPKYRIGPTLVKGLIAIVPMEIGVVIADVAGAWDTMGEAWPYYLGALLSALGPVVKNFGSNINNGKPKTGLP